ncbi:MAG: tetratricopeptide repeat protein, partial [Treponema sp.]|nr:tetratricopeptide repeat protein [Treponema sp.]
MRMRKNFFVFVPALFVLYGCSTVPERPLEINNIRNMAESQLDLANREIDQGNYEGALELLDEARRIAVSSDSPSLRIRTNLSLGNVHFYQGNVREAFRLWLTALTEAEQEGSVELAAVCRLHIDRGRLFRAAAAGIAALLPENRPAAAAESAAATETEAADAAERGRRNNRRRRRNPVENVSVAQSVRDNAVMEIAVINDRQYTAFGWTV